MIPVSASPRDEPVRRRPFLPPSAGELGWTPYLYLVYLGFLAIEPAIEGASLAEWLAIGAAVAVFLPLYFASYWLDGRPLVAVVVALTLLGVAVVPWNTGGGGFFIYAAAVLGPNWRPAIALRGIAAILAVICVEAYLLDLHPLRWMIFAAFTAIIGAINIHHGEVARKNERLRLAQEEVERLAKTAERERIARDLHDLLGHTLSVISIKSELAAKLAERDPARAADEIREVHEVSRRALAEVRRAVRGYRATGGRLAEETANARAALAAAGLAEEIEGEPTAIAAAAGPTAEAVLALALREGVTNVLRHARAGRCRIALEAAAGRARLTIEDDGLGGAAADGAGLAGMRERVEALGGRVERSARADGSGTRLAVELPIAAPPADEPAATANGPAPLGALPAAPGGSRA